MKQDKFGDKIKQLEMNEAGRRAIPGVPLIARLDGRAFHSFTRGLKRPYDLDLAICMTDTTKALVDEFQATIGYTQSDEITLIWTEPKMFDGRYQKYTSLLSGFASAIFMRRVLAYLPERADKVPHFDCRVWQVGNLNDAIDVLVWREDDATKNSVSMLARAHFSHKEVQNKGRREMLDMLHNININWNEYPAHFKRGGYFQRVVTKRKLTEDERMKIPAKHRPPPDAEFDRAEVSQLDVPPIRKIDDAKLVLFGATSAT